MRTHPVSERFIVVAMLIVATLVAAAFGAWQSTAPSQTAAAEQRSAFVQSGGLTSDVDPSLPNTSQALGHARAPGHPEVAATTF